MKFFHLAIAVTDLANSRKFYESVFGLKYRSEGERHDLKIKFVNLENDSHNVIELFQHKSPLHLEEDLMDFRRAGIKHVAFIVDNIETTLDKATSMGAKVIWPPKVGVTVKRTAFISDPDGIPVELVEI